MITEGQQVAYAGDTDPFNEVGSLGRVVAVSGQAAHVQWTSGPKVGSVDFVEQFELVEARGPAQSETTGMSFDATLDMPTSASLQVRAAYDEAGEDGLVLALDEAGHLAMLAEYADRALEALVGDLRADPSFREVLGQLEADEADTVVSRVATVLLGDRIKEA
jgi:hypothetical protein